MDDEVDEVLLHGTFQQFPQCRLFYSVRLGRQNLIYEEQQEVGATYRRQSLAFTSILLKDVLNVILFKSKFKQDVASYFKIITYLPTGKEKKRKKISFAFRVNESDDEQENILTAEIWVRTLRWLMVDPKLEQEVLQAKEELPPTKRFLILINPKSGKGKSMKLFRKTAEPMFIEAGVQYEEYVTESSGQGMDMAYSLDLDKWDGVIICSGDGLAYEVINGFMQREDWETAIKMPIGIIPTGSGNALCASILYAAGEPWHFTSAVYAILRGQSKPMDICSLTNSKRHIYAFLSITWGLISDIDIESERFRMLGNARFTVGAVSRILSLRTYYGKVSYIPSDVADDVDSSLDSGSQRLDNDHGWDEQRNRGKAQAQIDDKNTQAQLLAIAEVAGKDSPIASSTSSSSPKRDKVVIDVDYGDSDCKKRKNRDCTRHHSLMAEQNHDVSCGIRANSSVDLNGFEHNKLHNFASEMVKPSPKREVHGPPDSCLSPLLNELPDNWIEMDGKFVTVFVMLISHLGSDLFAVPHAKLDDGNMYLLYVKSGASRKSILDMFTSMETGDHLRNPDVVIKKVKAFRIEPAFERLGYIAVDGEIVEYDAIQGQIHNGLARIFML